jgi:hypothetical protein
MIRSDAAAVFHGVNFRYFGTSWRDWRKKSLRSSGRETNSVTPEDVVTPLLWRLAYYSVVPNMRYKFSYPSDYFERTHILH